MSIEIPQDIVEMNQEILSALKADEVDLSRKYTRLDLRLSIRMSSKRTESDFSVLTH